MKNFSRNSVIGFLLIVILFISQVSYAHVLPITFPQFQGKRVPLKEYWYVRIMPSPYLEGFASFEFCPLMQDENKDKYLVKSERNKLGLGDYHHDLINPECQRPYQMDPQGPPVYFDLRELNNVLSQDDMKVFTKNMVSYGVTSGVAYLAFTAVNPFLLGLIVSSAAVSVVSSGMDEIDDRVSHLNHIPKNKQHLLSGIGKGYVVPENQAEEMLRLTQIKYFSGEMANQGHDIYWPIMPEGELTFGECIKSCKKEIDQEQNQRDSKLSWIEKSLRPSKESIYSINPIRPYAICDQKCNGLPSVRTSMAGIWKDLYLETIYKAGNRPVWSMYPKKKYDGENTTDFKPKELFQRYHTEKHFDWSLWRTAKDINGMSYPNHYTHGYNLKNVQYQDSSISRYPLCDFKRLTKFNSYLKNGGDLQFAEWLETKCHFEKNIQCREYLDAPIQTGDEVCTVISEK